MTTTILYLHVLSLVYWLGGDLGTFLSSRYIVRDELGVEARKTAFSILQECDLGPKLAMPLTLGSGFHLTATYWPNLFVSFAIPMVWLVVLLWLSLVYFQHHSGGNPRIATADLWLRYGVLLLGSFFAFKAWQAGLANWVALKMAVFLSLVGLGIAVRYALKPFALAYVQMVTDGATAETNDAMRHHLAVCRRYVWVIWIGLFVNAALGLRLVTV